MLFYFVCIGVTPPRPPPLEDAYFTGIYDPHHFIADPDLDPAVYYNAGPDPAFHFNADPDSDPALHQDDSNLRPPDYRLSRPPIFERPRPSTAPFKHQKLLNFGFNADPDPAFHSNADPNPAYKNDPDPKP